MVRFGTSAREVYNPRIYIPAWETAEETLDKAKDYALNFHGIRHDFTGKRLAYSNWKQANGFIYCTCLSKKHSISLKVINK